MPLVEIISILLISFGINLIPFASPSNLLIASSAAVLVGLDPFSVGVAVALGATCAKLIHYTFSFILGDHVNKKRRDLLDRAAIKTKRWAGLAVFLSAATPIPDDPIIVPLGMMKYSWAKFSAYYFSGKLLITVIGAFLGGFGELLLSGYLSQMTLAVLSIILTVTVTVALMKTDVSKIVDKTKKKIGIVKSEEQEMKFYVEEPMQCYELSEKEQPVEE